MWEDIGTGEVTELLVALIRDACVNDGTPESGEEHRAVDTLRGYFGTDGEVFEPVPGRQSVVYRVPGTDPTAPSIMLMGHTDVVPVSPEGWTVDPFAGNRSDGFVWGRGAIDMLTLAGIAQLALRACGERIGAGEVEDRVRRDDENPEHRIEQSLHGERSLFDIFSLDSVKKAQD